MDWTFGAVGDVFVNREDPENAFRHSRDVLREIDVVFGNCEGAYTDECGMAPSTGWRVAAPPTNGDALGAAGFRHHGLCQQPHPGCRPRGPRRYAATAAATRCQNRGCGSKRRRSPCRGAVEHNGVRVGFLAYASVYQAGYEARDSVPGLAAMRIHSHYYIPDWDAYGRVEPGAPPTVRTIPYPEDIERLKLPSPKPEPSMMSSSSAFIWGRPVCRRS